MLISCSHEYFFMKMISLVLHHFYLNYFSVFLLQPIRNHNPWMLLYFISFLLIVSFFVLNMFVGVVVENFHKCRQDQEEEEARQREEKRHKRMEKRRRSECFESDCVIIKSFSHFSAVTESELQNKIDFPPLYNIKSSGQQNIFWLVTAGQNKTSMEQIAFIACNFTATHCQQSLITMCVFNLRNGQLVVISTAALFRNPLGPILTI